MGCGGIPSSPAADSLGAPPSWWTRRLCRVTVSPAWLEFGRGLDGRGWTGGPGWMPVRRDLIGYTYEFENCEDSSFPVASLWLSSPSSMTGRWCKRTRRISRRITVLCIERRDNPFSFVDLRQITTAPELVVLTEASPPEEKGDQSQQVCPTYGGSTGDNAERRRSIFHQRCRRCSYTGRA